MNKIKQSFDEKRNKIEEAIIGDLKEFYGDQSEWDECSDNIVNYAVFYCESCSQLLKAILLYKYDGADYGKKYLVSDHYAADPKEDYDANHLNILKEYYYDRSLMTLLFNDKLNTSFLKISSNYHIAYLRKQGYKNEEEVLNDPIGPETFLSIFVPQMIVSKLLDVDYSSVIDGIDKEVKCNEMIWVYSWRLIYKILRNELVDIDDSWADLLTEWKLCFLNSDFHGFRLSNIFFLYFIYCQIKNLTFDPIILAQELDKHNTE